MKTSTSLFKKLAVCIVSLSIVKRCISHLCCVNGTGIQTVTKCFIPSASNTIIQEASHYAKQC